MLKGRIPKELFPIACTGSGDVVCLSLVGAHAVYFWVHDEEHRPSTYENCYLIALSLEEFLSAIHYRDLDAEMEALAKGARLLDTRH